ncbi:hypothetical protein L9F63_023850, partial [Diploptera punctata]
FREVLAELESKISTAEFLAIDGEFTGLHGTGQDVNAFDTPSQYYSKLRSNCMDFLLIQFGLCIFKYDEEKNKYTHRAYNFYIFPRGQTRSASDSRFLCQSSSIEFLASQGFDFNKLFKEGIPYLTQPEEQKMRENLEEKHKSEANSENNLEEPPPPIPIPDQHVSFIEDVCSKIEQFLESSESEELQLDQCNAFVRKLIYQEVGKRFDSNKLVLESRISDNKNRILFALRTGSEEVKKRKEKERMERELRELEDAIGFTSVIKKISESVSILWQNDQLDNPVTFGVTSRNELSLPCPSHYMLPLVIYCEAVETFQYAIGCTVFSYILSTDSREYFAPTPEFEPRISLYSKLPIIHVHIIRFADYPGMTLPTVFLKMKMNIVQILVTFAHNPLPYMFNVLIDIGTCLG